MVFRKFIVGFLVLFFVLGCSQNNETMVNQNPHITADNIVDEIAKQVKHYDKEPTYWLKTDAIGGYELYVNDIPVFNMSDNNLSYAGAIEINSAILKSGKQKVKLKVFSKRKSENINVNIFESNSHKDYMKAIKTKEYITKVSSEKDCYVIEFIFDATVPYNNKGWSDGQDLTKFGQQELEVAVIAFYKKMWDRYNNRNEEDEIYNLIWKKEAEIAISNYFTKEDIKGFINVYTVPYIGDYYKMQPLRDYKMEVYGDGKVVSLKQTGENMSRRGESALWLKLEGGHNTSQFFFIPIYLYLPQGKTLKDGLQIIR